MKTKISLLFERGAQEYQINLNHKELDVWLHLMYGLLPFGKEKWPIHKSEIKNFTALLRKLEHGVNDVYHNGVTFELMPKNKQNKKLVCKKCKDRYYILKKPKWCNKLRC